MSDILRQNLVALISTLRNQDYLCDLLMANRVLISEDKEEVMCQKTNAAKNRALVDFVRCRFNKAFKVFCDGLDTTRQHDLLKLLDPARGLDVASEPVNRTVDCKICMNAPIGIAFRPCGHACCCQTCAQEILRCPICRGAIFQRIVIFV